MRLLPSEEERLQLFLAAELAWGRRARGLALTQAEAVALIADEVCEAARDGRSYADAEAAGYALLGPGDVADGVAALVRRVEVEALFGDGSRLLVLLDPIGSSGPPPQAEVAVEWLARDRALTVVNEGEVAVGVTSHFHFFEVNRALRFDRAAAWGMRLAIAPGAKGFFDPGTPHEVFLAPIRGARVVRGHGGLADGPLDADGALDAALALARERGYRGA
ncbi:MAG TPA: urease subunit gamma [Solirubrobacteraceae bacterium]|nr:urease subunit gamma [Solirubrobacteraceae bacterium]